MPTVVLETRTSPSGKKVPLNSEGNRANMSRAYIAEGDASMTPVMCGFLFLALAQDKSSDAYKKTVIVAERLRATYKDDGMQDDHAIAAAMRLNVEQPAMFGEMATVRCPCCNGPCHIVKD